MAGPACLCAASPFRVGIGRTDSAIAAPSSSSSGFCCLPSRYPLLQRDGRISLSKGGLYGYEVMMTSRGQLRENGNRHAVSLSVQAINKRSPKRLKYTSAGTRKSSTVAYVQVDPTGSDVWKLESIVDLIKRGAVGVIPTDTVYAIVCDLKNRDSVDRLYRIKNIDTKKPLSILCRSFQDIDTYTLGFPRGNSHGQTNVFRAARQCLPGPYTFILPASKEMPKQCTDFGGSAAVSCAPRKSVGVRMPDDEICKALLDKLDNPLLCTSVKRPADDQWMLDPVIIGDTYGAANGKEGLDFVVDGGVRLADPSTVVDMTGVKPAVLRPGKGIVEDWMVMEARDSTEHQLEYVGGLWNPYA